MENTVEPRDEIAEVVETNNNEGTDDKQDQIQKNDTVIRRPNKDRTIQFKKKGATNWTTGEVNCVSGNQCQDLS